MSATSLPFHEPTLRSLLIHSSFLLLLNLTCSIVDATIYSGLIAQVLLGTIWGAPVLSLPPPQHRRSHRPTRLPGASPFSLRGGLTTSVMPLLQNLTLSATVAVTGIGLPIAISFLLGPLLGGGVSPLQCFAAGAALSATSLGTTFMIMPTASTVPIRHSDAAPGPLNGTCHAIESRVCPC
jgi:hypothetical protein